MSAYIYKYRDPDLNLYHLNSSHILLLQIYSSSFSYAIVSQNRLLVWAEDCDLSLLSNPGKEHELLSYSYKNIATGLPSTGFTLIADALFNADKVADLARFLDVKPNEKVFSQSLDDHNHIIYKADGEIVKTAAKFGLQKAVYINKGWINTIGNNNPGANDIFINIDKQQAAIAHFAAGQLRFYNTFEFNNADELTYYASLVAQELKLQPADLTLVLSGDVAIYYDINHNRLAEFFKSVKLNSLHQFDVPAEIDQHTILPLAALLLCVSSEVF